MWSDSLVFAHVLPVSVFHTRAAGWKHWPPAGAAPSLSPQDLSPDRWASGSPILSPLAPLSGPCPCPFLGSSGFQTKHLPVPSGGSERPHSWAWVWAQLRCPFLHQEVLSKAGPASWDSPWDLLATPGCRHTGISSVGTAQRYCAGGRRVSLRVNSNTVTGSRDTGCSSHSQLLPSWPALSLRAWAGCKQQAAATARLGNDRRVCEPGNVGGPCHLPV